MGAWLRHNSGLMQDSELSCRTVQLTVSSVCNGLRKSKVDLTKKIIDS